MKKLSFAVAAAALLSLASFGATAQAQPHGRLIQAQVYVMPPPPPHHYRHHEPRRYHAPPPRYHRDARRGWQPPHRGYRDSDRDGVPNRYDRAPHNPYRR